MSELMQRIEFAFFNYDNPEGAEVSPEAHQAKREDWAKFKALFETADVGCPENISPTGQA